MLDLPTTEGGFRVICADPPWRFKSNSAARPGRNAMQHYDCMTLDEIKSLPVAATAADDCALFMWITGPFLVLGAHLPIMKAWGFKPSGVCFTWVKQTRKGAGLHWGTGFTTRANAEFVVLGKRGKSVRRDAGVHSIIMAPVREHSRKPDEFYRRVERYAAGPYMDMFSRQSRDGWHAFGDQAIQFDPAPEISASMVLRPRFDIAAQIATLGADSLLPPERLAA